MLAQLDSVKTQTKSTVAGLAVGVDAGQGCGQGGCDVYWSDIERNRTRQNSNTRTREVRPKDCIADRHLHYGLGSNMRVENRRKEDDTHVEFGYMIIC